MASSTEESMCLNDYDVYGFDMDCCLAKYYLDALYELCYNYLTKYLVENKGYDSRLLEAPQNHRDLVSRGLLLDKEKGNLIKLGADGLILRCSHGSKMLSRSEITQIYGTCWDKLDEFKNKIDHVPERYWLLESFFDLPQGAVFSRMVDLHDEKNGGKAQEGYNLWPDLFDSIRDYYSCDPSNENRVFNAVVKTPEKFVRSCSDSMKSWLMKLKKTNKTVFLMTSSWCPFTKQLLTYILGPNMNDYFDFYLCTTHKPKFYYMDKPFVKEGETEGRKFDNFDVHGWYNEGNIENLKSVLTQITGKETPRVLYAGDGMKNDAFPSKHYANWDSLMVLENMLFDEELHVNANKTGLPQTSSDSRQLMDVPSGDLIYDGYSRWGSVFGDEIEGERVLTFFGDAVRKHADLAVPLLDFLADLPLDHKFTKSNAYGGYYPFVPAYLRGFKQ